MATLKKTEITYSDHNHGVLQKFWIVGQPLETSDAAEDVCLNYIANADDPINRNEERSSWGYAHPKYFLNYDEARACAKFWNEKIPWKYDATRLARRHDMTCAFKPHLVKVAIA